MTRPILDYAIIGNCRVAALISIDGSIDWLCVPRFDSPSIFGALLDPVKGGTFRISPVDDSVPNREYVSGTNVLVTTFRTATGTIRLTDVMPVASETDKRHMLWPDHEILRRIECIDGEVEVEVFCDPRPEYGARTPRLIKEGAIGLCYDRGPDALILRSDIQLTTRDNDPGARGTEKLRAGDTRFVSISFAHGGPGVVPMLGDSARDRIDMSVKWWQGWSAQCTYQGEYREIVVRSALALKLMTYAPSGAVIAAPTTSLPEAIGGVRNWDYRYCWLRDASLTTRALFELGFSAEAESFLSWLLHATRLTWPELQVLYDVYGETRLPERALDHLSGYADSRPVRVGNDAAKQFQLDVYGSVIDAAFRFTTRGGEFDRVTRRMLRGLGITLCRKWREPDEGLWEERAGRKHHTFSKVMSWVGLDRLIQMHERDHLSVPVNAFRRERDAIRELVEQRGYNERIGAYTATIDGEDLDASLLQLALTGYCEPNAPRMRNTYTAIMEYLSMNGLLYRYKLRDGLPPGEGAFGICGFWAVDYQARAGDTDGAKTAFENLIAFRNDVGLMAEEIDPKTGMGLGNFPQAFTHIGLINAAVTLGKQTGQHPHKADQEQRTGAHV